MRHLPPKGCTATAATTTLRGLQDTYWPHAQAIYRRRDGEPTREALNMRSALDRFRRFAGDTCDPTKINRHMARAWLDQLAAEKLTRSYCNSCLGRLRRFVRWAADLNYVPITLIEEMRLVRPLRPHRSLATEPESRPTLDLKVVHSVLDLMQPIPRAVIQLLMLTGARPGEILGLTMSEVFLDGYPRFQPLQHKTAHHGITRLIALNEAAVRIVQPIWRPMCPADYLFPGERRGTHYTRAGLDGAVKRACKRKGIAGFCLYDIRRNVARKVRTEKGLDAAQALLGHTHSSTTEKYAPIDPALQETFGVAMDAARAIGNGIDVQTTTRTRPAKKATAKQGRAA